jgi:Trk K+ transport system NAD-binding subunit/nucleotide-binding universal stress UspA family protein
MKPRVIIVGAHETGANLARRMCAAWDVSVVDSDAEVLASELLSECLSVLQGDGTSALVLDRAGAGGAHALVAVTGEDGVNLEVLRVAGREFEIENLYAVLEDSETEPRYRELGVELVDRSQACSALLESRIERRKVATNIGLGRGEIMEVEVLANSSVIGYRLADLRPRQWLVGAVYRDGELIVPHGDTVLQEGDRVVIIGNPEILSSIATLIGAGESEFPLHYGANIVALGTAETLPLLDEVAYLLQSTAARQLELVLPRGQQPPSGLMGRCRELGLPVAVTPRPEEASQALVAEAALGDVGLQVLAPRPLPALARVGLRRSSTVKLVDLLSSPVLVGRGSFPYERVLLVLAELPFHQRAAQVAFDLVRKIGARKIGARLTLGVVHQPELVVGAEMREEVEERRRQLENLASMYHLEVELRVLEGNPIRQVVQVSGEYQLLVLPYQRRRSSFLTRPDVAQNLIHQARCSVLAMPHD